MSVSLLGLNLSVSRSISVSRLERISMLQHEHP